MSPGGTISNYLDCMEEGELSCIQFVCILTAKSAASPAGEEIDIRGPSGGITYQGCGDFDIDGEQFHFDKVCFRVH